MYGFHFVVCNIIWRLNIWIICIQLGSSISCIKHELYHFSTWDYFINFFVWEYLMHHTSSICSKSRSLLTARSPLYKAVARQPFKCISHRTILSRNDFMPIYSKPTIPCGSTINLQKTYCLWMIFCLKDWVRYNIIEVISLFNQTSNGSTV